MTHRENLFILYPPGLGGNHLANMLSLSNNYVTRFDLNRYDSPIKHANVNAHHFSDVPQFNIDIISKNLDRLSTQNNVFAGHWLAYHIFQNSGLLKHFTNRRYLTIQIPEQKTQAFVRLQKLGLGFSNFPWLLHEIRTLYKPTCLSLVCQERITDFYSVHPHQLFDQEFNIVLQDLHSQGFEINLDLNLAQSFHNKWLANLEKETPA